MTMANNKESFAHSARSVLRAVHQAEDNIEASAVVSRDGLIVASQLSHGADADRFGAMCASLLALASKAATEVDRGELRQVILDGTKGPMLLTHIGKFAVLAVAARPAKANLGKLIMETRAAAAKLTEIGNAL
ncbi:MAG: roadblock/LC7 domain-containing protein [Fluviicoccus sp.]|uniref:roadblock/LC7 domain-containing protein n=1 Tax=Fluviicoccus sp. TaxID=2003552 RepID=UPI0027256F78|nr:roadblock/LC7 domain-containing protein [Fluviicoccus sp.]MDO8331096.1 roadblock/LC7 domain-containing protein [Fluviicoccus sp.]